MTNAEKLARLYNRARPQGLGFLQATPEPMTTAEAQALLDKGRTYFDYLQGRVMKIDPTREPLDTRLYDRDNGFGAAEDALTGPYLAESDLINPRPCLLTGDN
jgi:hypothetical protein